MDNLPDEDILLGEYTVALLLHIQVEGESTRNIYEGLLKLSLRHCSANMAISIHIARAPV